MNDRLFETALGIAEPWRVTSADLDATAKTLTIGINFTASSRFAMAGETGVHPVHDTVSKRYQYLNFFQHECYLEVRVPRVKLPSGDLRALCRSRAGRGRLLRGHQPGHRRDVAGEPAATTMLPWPPTPSAALCCSRRAVLFVTEGREAEAAAGRRRSPGPWSRH